MKEECLLSKPDMSRIGSGDIFYGKRMPDADEKMSDLICCHKKCRILVKILHLNICRITIK